MGKIFVYIALLFATTLMAGEIHWAKDYKSGMALAKKQNKPVMFIISRDTCKYCIMLDNKTLKDKTITKAINRDFIAIRSWLNENDYVPEDLYAPGLPTVWFLLPNGEPMFQPVMGMVGKKDFLVALAVVKETFDEQNKGKKSDTSNKHKKK